MSTQANTNQNIYWPTVGDPPYPEYQVPWTRQVYYWPQYWPQYWPNTAQPEMTREDVEELKASLKRIIELLESK